jgi:cytochrome c553
MTTRRVKRLLFTVHFSLLTLLAFVSCRKGMVDQPRLKPLAEENFFADSRGSRLPPQHTVARGQLHDDQQFFTGKIDNRLVDAFPMPVTRELVARGRERYEIHCAVCHGENGEGDGSVVRHGFPRPASIYEQRLRDAPVGHLFDVITNGFGAMYPYAARVSVEDRWAIIAYIRTLQLSDNPSAAVVDPAARNVRSDR